jgi:hypothetical protein
MIAKVQKFNKKRNLCSQNFTHINSRAPPKKQARSDCELAALSL